MPSAVKKFQVDITTNPSVIAQTAEPIASNISHLVPVLNIMTVTPIFFDFGFAQPAEPVTLPVTNYQNAPDRITFAGNFAAYIAAGDVIVISGSTNNDGNYTVVSAVDSGGDTIVTVVEPLVAAPVDGNITFTPGAGNIENTNTANEWRETYPYRTMTRLVLGLYDGERIDWELQSIANQATWNTGTKEALAQAVADINALL